MSDISPQRRLFAAIPLLLGAMLVLAATRGDAQCTTQAQGSLVLSFGAGQNCTPGGPPPGPDALVANQTTSVAVSISNTSTLSTNIFPNCGTSATLTGFTHIDLSCTTTDCTNELQALTFVSCTPQAGVTCEWCGTMPTPADCNAANSCGAMACGADPNIVLLSYGAGLPLTSASFTTLASIDVTAAPGQQILTLFDNQGNYTCGLMGSRAESGASDLVVPGSSSGATGTAQLFYPAFCGDGRIEPQLGETCDPPGVSGCRADCTSCGNGVVENGSICTTLNTHLGQSCMQDSDCNDGFCEDGAASVIGTKCLVDTDCDSGFCSGGPSEFQPCSVRNGNADCRFCTAGVIGGPCTVNTDCDLSPGDGVCEGTCQPQADGACTQTLGTCTQRPETCDSTPNCDPVLCLPVPPTSTPTFTPTPTATSTPGPAGGCRVTGGGRLAGNETFPMVSFATHGGQVGASVGVATAFSLNSPCIKGQWQHVRHGNSGNFHASEFDSLNCACLSCRGGNTGGQLCPGSCGPQPPNAPANKICFSGPGNYTATNGPKTPSVVFRADVEDHGEPGRNDRYRIRIWFVDPTSAAGLALRQAVACGDPTTETVNTALAPDVDDGGTVDTGNEQIHKPTGRKCKL